MDESNEFAQYPRPNPGPSGITLRRKPLVRFILGLGGSLMTFVGMAAIPTVLVNTRYVAKGWLFLGLLVVPGIAALAACVDQSSSGRRP